MIGDIETRPPYIAVKLLLNTTIGAIHARMRMMIIFNGLKTHSRWWDTLKIPKRKSAFDSASIINQLIFLKSRLRAWFNAGEEETWRDDVTFSCFRVGHHYRIQEQWSWQKRFFLPYRQNLGLFFSLYSQAKQQRRKAVALLPRMKDRRPNTTLMLLLMSYGGLVSMLRQKKRLVFSSFFLSFFWPLHMNNDLFQAIEGLFRRSGGAGWQEGFND